MGKAALKLSATLSMQNVELLLIPIRPTSGHRGVNYEIHTSKNDCGR